MLFVSGFGITKTKDHFLKVGRSLNLMGFVRCKENKSLQFLKIQEAAPKIIPLYVSFGNRFLSIIFHQQVASQILTCAQPSEDGQ